MKRLAAFLFVIGCLGGAADAWAEPPPPTVLVDGTATVAISKTATSAEAQAAYGQAFAASVSNGHEQAEFVANQVGAHVGSLQQITPRGGFVDCFLPAEEGPLREGAPYEGAQPNFVWTENFGYTVAPVESAPATVPSVHKKRKKKHKHTAKKAVVAVRCEVSSRVLLSYLLT